jgi:HEAT repeat protein
MPLFPELAARPLEDLTRAFASGPAPADSVPEEEVPLWLDEVAVALAARGQEGLDALLQRLPATDEPRLRAALLALSFLPEEVKEKNRAGLEGLLLPLLQDPRPDVVAAAVDALTEVGGEAAGERVLPLLEHPAAEVVSSALRFLARRAPLEVSKPALLRALESPESLVRENAADELDDLGCVEALPRLRRLLDDEDEDVRQAARTAVSHLEDSLADQEAR